MQKIYILLLLQSLINCASVSQTDASSETSLDIRSFRSEFNQFMDLSGRSNAADAWRIWKETVAAKDPSFFEQVIGGSLDNKNWEASYQEAFTKAWPKLQKYRNEMNIEFDRFPNLLKENFLLFKKMFPDFDLSKIPVYGVPSLIRFNGQGASVNGRTVLAFGIDTIVLLDREPQFFPGTYATSNPKVLYAHEIFHIYHNEKMKFTRDVFMQRGNLIHSAWLEGLATYVAGLMNSTASDADLLMDSELGKTCQESGDALLSQFRKVARETFRSERGRDLYRNWFLLSSKDKTLPVRAGYCVGLTLVRRMAQKKIDLETMVSWTIDDIPKHVEEFIY